MKALVLIFTMLSVQAGFTGGLKWASGDYSLSGGFILAAFIWASAAILTAKEV